MQKNYKLLKRLINWRVLLAILLLQNSLVLMGQVTYNISGKVTDAASGEPVIGAAIQIENTTIGTVTDLDGIYKLEINLPAGDYKLKISSVGYEVLLQDISLVDQANISLDITLREDYLRLNEVVVTGTSVATSKRQLGNAISTISKDDIAQSGSLGIDGALSGKITGAVITQNSGNPAGGISIRLRGASTINGQSDPLYIVDGVIVNNGSGAINDRSTELLDLGGYSQNRLVDINPNDIERIEVIKGAAAAAIYGSRASNGVVQIFTKRGSQGKPKLTFSTNVIISNVRKKIDVNETPLVWEDPFDNDNLNTQPAQRFDYQDYFFVTGVGTDNYLSLSGGQDKTKYFLSASYFDNEGIIRNTDFQRISGRARVDQVLNNWAALSFGLNYSYSASNDIPNGGISAAYGAMTGFVFSDNSVDDRPDASGTYPVTSLLVPRTNPREAVDRFEFGQKTNRVIGDLQLNLTPFEGFGIDYILGIDTYNQSGTGFIPVGNTSPNPDGFARRAELNFLQLNNDLNFRYEKDITPSLKSTSSAGLTLQFDRRESIGISAEFLSPVAKTTDAGTVTDRIDFRADRVIRGAFLQQTFGLSDKLFVTGAIRVDGASSFGEDERSQFYPKASASYVISEENFWQNGIGRVINNLKVRASWGQSGNLTGLGPFERFTNYNPVPINGQTGLVPSTQLGNSEIRPEQQSEIEFGLDMGLLNNRLGVEFTYYNQDVEDLLLTNTQATTTGFAIRTENVGEMSNRGIEVLVRAAPIQEDNLRWNITATYSRNRNEVNGIANDDLIRLPGSFNISVAQNGEALGVFFGTYYARESNGNISLDSGGRPLRAVDSNGSIDRRIIGDPNPDYTASLINEIEYKNFSFRVQLDAIQGFDVFNFDRRLMDNAIFGGGPGVGEELAGRQVKGFGRAEANVFEEYIEDGSFIKLRELGISYSVQPDFLGISNLRFNFIGRNLFSIDDYSGWDPEINGPGQSNGVRGFIFASVPIPQTYQFGLTATF